MNSSPTLDTLAVVNPRFARSVSLVRDAQRSDALDGYILTPVGRDVLRRLADALRGESPTRAWSLTGPYGSGKSAFALLTAQALAGSSWVRQKARDFLDAADAELANQFFGTGRILAKKTSRLCPVLVTGSRQPLEKALAATLASSLRSSYAVRRPPLFVEQLEQLATEEKPSGSKIVQLFEEANEYLSRFDEDGAGILLIIDELGKFLEYGAINPDQGDVFVLQELAEAATRSSRPFLFVTILHQALDRYADHMSPSRRAEWAKVQGRFEDVAFEERTDQILRLISHAIRHHPDGIEAKALRKKAKALSQDVVSLGIRSGGMSSGELHDLLAACYPLHPLTSLVLGPLFRQLAQNERSLFAFLASSEPFGFKDFLKQNTVRDGAYRLDQLYDYAVASLGSSLFTQHRGKLWAEVQSALERLHDATETEIRLAKSIGLLQALGPPAGVTASDETLRIALKGTDKETQAEDAIQSLKRRSVVVFRRHMGSYALWEGSDVDIDDRLLAARQSVERDQNIAAFLMREMPPQPLIARRHYFKTGTLRFFDASYVDRIEFQSDLFHGDIFYAEQSGADGKIVLCLPADADDRETMRQSICAAKEGAIIAVLPQEMFDLRELCHELVCLRWISLHTPELQSDRTARRELNARIGGAEQNLRNHLEWMFSPGNANGCEWYHRGKPVSLSSRRQLNDLVSSACDRVYSATPTWRNELINRRALSSSAAAARRNLIEAMFERVTEDSLGFEGNPPEKSIYETLLKATRLHRKHGGVIGIHPPDSKAEPAVQQLWNAIDGFLDETQAGRKSVDALFAMLRRPPFGLKDGILSVLLAAVLVNGHSQLALYEEGSFVPRPNAAVFERIFRSPEKFELQRFRISGPRAEVFQQYAAMLTKAITGEPELLSIVRPLVRTVKELPDYVGKTKNISETAQHVLRAVKDARQPDRLLFTDLPVASGFPPFEATGKIPSDRVDAYFLTLRNVFSELQRAYPHLLAEIEQMFLKAFGQTGHLAKARKTIEHEAKLVLNVAVSVQLKAFLMRAADAEIEDATWLESMATLLAGKPPTYWDDQDRARFEVQLAATARTFNHFKVLAYEMERGGFALLDGDKEMLRISISVPDGCDVERVVKVPPQLASRASQAQDGLRRVLREQKLLGQKEVSVAILARLARELLSDAHDQETE